LYRYVTDAERAMEAGEANAAEKLIAAQERFEAMGSNTVERRVSDVLSGLGFAREAWDRPCSALSGGWQMRVALARLLLSPAGDSQATGINGGFLLLAGLHSLPGASDWLHGHTGCHQLVF
jgi:ATP-binding cassette subfamily F protein 3